MRCAYIISNIYIYMYMFTGIVIEDICFSITLCVRRQISEIRPLCPTMRFWVKYLLLSLIIYCTILYTQWYYSFKGGKKILKNSSNARRFVISVVCCGKTYSYYRTQHIIQYYILFYSELWVLSLIDLSENSRIINFISNSLKGDTSTWWRWELMCTCYYYDRSHSLPPIRI